MIPLGVLGAARVAAGGLPVAGYSAWYDFSDDATLTLSGSEITDVLDKSGNGYHLTRMTSGPTRATGWPGTSLAYAQSDGTNLRGLTNAAGAGISGDFTWLAVAYAATSARTNSNADAMVRLRTLASYKDSTVASLKLWQGAGALTISTTADDITGKRVHARTLSGTAHSYWLGTTAKVSNMTGTAGGSGPLDLFAEQSNSNGSDWRIGEVIIYPSALSQADRESVTSYLSTKWSIT